MKDGDTCVVVYDNGDALGGTYPDLETALDYIANWLSEVDVKVDVEGARIIKLADAIVDKAAADLGMTTEEYSSGCASTLRIPEKELRESLVVSPETPNGWTVTWDVGDRSPVSYQVLKSMYRSERLSK